VNWDPRRGVIFLLVVLVVLLMRNVDMQHVGPWSCVPVEIAGIYTKYEGPLLWGREVKYFDVTSINLPSKKYPVRFDGTFPETYVGPGALWTAASSLTGQKYYRLTGRCADQPVM
jgi:hypothetical protein